MPEIIELSQALRLELNKTPASIVVETLLNALEPGVQAKVEDALTAAYLVPAQADVARRKAEVTEEEARLAEGPVTRRERVAPVEGEVGPERVR